jgi:biopolymer transport protein ExbD
LAVSFTFIAIMLVVASIVIIIAVVIASVIIAILRKSHTTNKQGADE